MDGPLRIEDEGLRGICWGTGGREAVRFVLELDAVSGRLRGSGVFGLVIGGADTGGEIGWCVEPMDESETSEDAEPMASTLMLIQSSPDCLREDDGMTGWSLEVDLRSCCVKLSPRGLNADFESFIDDCEGDVTSFFPKGFEKLHFFEGVL